MNGSGGVSAANLPYIPGQVRLSVDLLAALDSNLMRRHRGTFLPRFMFDRFKSSLMLDRLK